MHVDLSLKFDEYRIKIDNKNMSYMIYHKGHSPKTYEEILSTLKKIEKILKENLINKFEDEGDVTLQDITQEVYYAKSHINPSFLLYKEKRARKQCEKINVLYNRIENLNNPPPALPGLNLELISIVFSFLFPKDLNSMASVNREAKQICDNQILYLAKKAGYQGSEEVFKANIYLKELFSEINTLTNFQLSCESILKDELIIDDVFVMFNDKRIYNPKFGKVRNFIFSQKINDTPSEWNLFNQMTEQTGQTALLHATLHNDLSAINFLLKIGAVFDLNDFNLRQKTALIAHAAYNGDEFILQRLIDQGIEINLKDREGVFPIHYAAGEGHTACVKLLLNNQTIDLQEELGHTPLIKASKSNRVAVVELLLNCRADIHLTTKNGNTALHYAVYNGHELVARLLLKNGINVNALNNYELTALHYAVRKKNTPLIELLKSHGAKNLL